MVVGCVGGGSNFAGLTFPFLRRVLRGEAKTRFVAAEPAACPTLTRGAYAYDFGDTCRPDAADAHVHAGSRFRAAARARGWPALPRRLADRLRPRQERTRGGTRLPSERDVRGRGALRAQRGHPACAGARSRDRAVFDEADAAREAGEERVIPMGLCGHGHFDMWAYDAYLAGNWRTRVQGVRHGSRAGASPRRRRSPERLARNPPRARPPTPRPRRLGGGGGTRPPRPRPPRPPPTRGGGRMRRGLPPPPPPISLNHPSGPARGRPGLTPPPFGSAPPALLSRNTRTTAPRQQAIITAEGTSGSTSRAPQMTPRMAMNGPSNPTARARSGASRTGKPRLSCRRTRGRTRAGLCRWRDPTPRRRPDPPE